ncbi:3-deoxy-manno-octulosonate cytidylyltransferase [Helicobacter sp. MIT 05-5294]|uniref:3-deoxy-manno-octulosonate cytidylyltransferase n=1 Tax=Helicobacter sp. MIT 05-5294 TaxID=1548150 RepID=UPI00051FA2F9|nr:3-deoxy-manno-octulosonate cytidylyltransferase [Helicobacter sp. MIT 05-5294]TLD88640.1 3-deoxy-manno-octulosonate cytidylyltransferase [Helicobacter sp. MIT 05-5294]
MIIIPARLKSSRFPNKVLAQIRGIPMVVRTAELAKSIDDVVVACDEPIIAEVCTRYGVRAILTSNTHESGTDRIAECARILNLSKEEIIINLQGDEPFLEQEVILRLKHLMENEAKIRGVIPFMGSCAKAITKEEAKDPNLVKVVLNAKNEAIYFSRSLIPYDRENTIDSNDARYLGHLGIYAFSGASLQEFCKLPKSTLESLEKLEQLRALENAKTIVIAKVQSQSFGIDTKEDMERALKQFGV